MATKKLLNPTKQQARLNETYAHYVAMNLVANGGAVLLETFGFTQEQVTQWAVLTAAKAKAKIEADNG